MDLRQFRPTDESYDLNVPNVTNQLQVLERQPRNENPTPTSSNGRRARNRNKDNASKMADVPLRRSQRLIAQQNASKPTAPKEDTPHLAELNIDHSYCKRTDNVSNANNDGYYTFKKGTAALQKMLCNAGVKSKRTASRRTRHYSPEQNGAICLTKCGKRTDATGETLNNVDASSKIDMDGVTYTTYQSSLTQTKQIDVYKMEHKITSDESEPNDDLYIELGPLGTLVPFNKFKMIPWSEALQATHDLLSLVFPLNILETHVISLRFAPLTLSAICKGKPRLDDNKLYDIRYCVTERTKMSKEACIYIIARRLLQLAKRRGETYRGFVLK